MTTPENSDDQRLSSIFLNVDCSCNSKGFSPLCHSCGVELDIVQQGIPEAIPIEACYLGWQKSLSLLAPLLEPEIPA